MDELVKCVLAISSRFSPDNGTSRVILLEGARFSVNVNSDASNEFPVRFHIALDIKERVRQTHNDMTELFFKIPKPANLTQTHLSHHLHFLTRHVKPTVPAESRQRTDVDIDRKGVGREFQLQRNYDTKHPVEPG